MKSRFGEDETIRVLLRFGEFELPGEFPVDKTSK